MYSAKLLHHRLDRLFKWLPFTVQNILAQELSPTDTVLDIGCGPISPLRLHKVKYSVGIDIWKPYIVEAKKKKTHNDLLLADCLKVNFKPETFDVVLALDLIEHLDKDEGRYLIDRMKQWARKKVIISVPNGYTKGHLADGNPFQKHRSGWSPAELQALGFCVKGIGVKLPNYASTQILLFYLMRYGTYPLRLLTYYYPQLAYDLVSIWRKSNG